MYAQRHGSGQINRGSLSLSVAIVGGLLAAAMLSPTVISHIDPDRKLTIIDVFTPPPPPPPKPQPRTPTKAQPTPERPDTPTRIVDTAPDAGPIMPYVDPGPIVTPGAGDSGGIVIDPPQPPAPVIVGSQVDPRYAGDFQPVYPAEERRAGNEGVVTLRVLIGVDGRVRQVERLLAPSDAFWRATEQRALSKWRFTPATRDGIPYESWRKMTVRFKLEQE